MQTLTSAQPYQQPQVKTNEQKLELDEDKLAWKPKD